jgi:hypothetical protein
VWRDLACCLAVLLCHACGRLGFEPSAGPDGAVTLADAASADAAVPHDASAPAPSCDWSGGAAFEPPVLLALPGAPSGRYDPFLSDDGRELYFNGGGDIYHATRTTGMEFGPAERVTSLSGASGESGFSVARDGLVGLLDTDRPGGRGGFDVWLVRRSTPTDAFDVVDALPQVNSTGNDFDSEILSDGSGFWFSARARADCALVQCIYFVRRDATGAFGVPELVDVGMELRAAADPTVTPDQRLMVLMSAGELYYATRADPSGPFGPSTPLTDLNEPGAEDGHAHLRRDGCELVFSSDRTGRAELYVAAFQPP